RQAEAFRRADPERPVKLAFEVVYAVAQGSPGESGLYLYHTDPGVVQSYVDFTREHDMLLILDLQNGLADVRGEVENALPFLVEPHVHLALDPEFTMPAGKLPGVSIGTLDAEQINAAQQVLSDF